MGCGYVGRVLFKFPKPAADVPRRSAKPLVDLMSPRVLETVSSGVILESWCRSRHGAHVGGPVEKCLDCRGRLERQCGRSAGVVKVPLFLD